jgi:F-type H+-transporting ATPase subunit b
MDEIIQQIEALLLGAVPTALLFIVLVLAYQFLLQGPLTRVLRERRARTQGAVEDAEKAIATAETKATEYAERLHQARVEVYKLREERVKQWSSERDSVLDAARQAALKKVTEAVAQIENEVAEARKSIQAAAPELAAQVVRAILPQTAGGIR